MLSGVHAAMAVVLSARKEPVVGTPELLDWLGGMANMVRSHAVAGLACIALHACLKQIAFVCAMPN